MKNNFKTALGACLLLGVVAGARPAEAQTLASLPTGASAAAVTGEAKPLLAWVDFCQREPRECAVDPAEPATIALSPRVWQTIVSVNRKVNAEIRAVTDLEHWGVADRWDLPTDGYGDCEDFQLLKRKLLAESGLPRRAMRMTVVIDEKREGHAVLTIRTDRGDYILDNKTNAVLPWQQTGYVYVKRESQAGLGWASLGGATSPAMTANR
jgi:predicted transglutaminase-like cysteine proteinase